VGTRTLTIAVLDSGVGCLSFLPVLRKTLPAARFVFAMDNANFPYGPKSEDEVIGFVHALARSVTSQYAPDMIVIACNTASTVVLPSLRARFNIPVVGVVPAIKPAATLSRTRVIALLATPGTVSRTYIDDLIRQFGEGCMFLRVGSTDLVTMAEKKLRGTPVDLDELRLHIAPLFERNRDIPGQPDTVVLGCTHFPLLVDELVQAARWPVSWIDSSEAVANRVLALAAKMEKQAELATDPVENHIAVFTSGHDIDALRPWLQQNGITEAAVLR
jgi:glutamate racemase